MKTPRSTQSFQIKPSVRKSWLWLAVAGAIATAGGFALGRAIPAGSTVLTIGLLMTIWSRRATIVRLFDDHFEMKLAPLAGLRKVRYCDIEAIEMLPKNVARLTLVEDKPVKIPLNMLEDEDQDQLMRFLESSRAA